MAECTGLENRQGKPSWVQIPRPPPNGVVKYGPESPHQSELIGAFSIIDGFLIIPRENLCRAQNSAILS